MYALLNRIEKPEDVKALTVRELEQLASELRHFIIDTVRSEEHTSELQSRI